MRKISQLEISPWPWKSIQEEQIIDKVLTYDGRLLFSLGMDSYSTQDARLIAAAPELYDCLREAVVESCHECEDRKIENCRGKCFVAKWRDALAKASGEREAK